MKKFFIVFTVFLLSFPVFGLSKIKLSQDSYNLEFNKIDKIKNVKQQESEYLIVDGRNIKINVQGAMISITGEEKSTIEKIIFPANVEFNITKNKQNLKFHDGVLKIESEDGKDFVELNKDGKIFITDGDDVVKIDEDGIFITSEEGDLIEIGKKGLILKSEGEEKNLGFLGQLIGNLAGKITHYAINKKMNYNIFLNEKINDSLADRDLLGDDGLNIDINTDNIKDATEYMKSVEKYSFENIDSLSLKVVASNYSILRSEDGKLTAKIFKYKYPKDKYSVDFKQEDGELTVEEKIKGSVNYLNVKYVFYVPKNMKIKVNSTSGIGYIKDVRFKKIKIDSISGDLTIINSSSSENLTIENVSGDINISNFNTANAKISSTSGELGLNNFEVDNFQLNVTSGDVSLNKGKINYLKYNSTSGDFTGYNCDILDFDAKTISGDVELKNSRLKNKKFNTLSGDFLLSELEISEEIIL